MDLHFVQRGCQRGTSLLRLPDPRRNTRRRSSLALTSRVPDISHEPILDYMLIPSEARSVTMTRFTPQSAPHEPQPKTWRASANAFKPVEQLAF
jgi:hypothetical protein